MKMIHELTPTQLRLITGHKCRSADQQVGAGYKLLPRFRLKEAIIRALLSGDRDRLFYHLLLVIAQKGMRQHASIYADAVEAAISRLESPLYEPGAWMRDDMLHPLPFTAVQRACFAGSIAAHMAMMKRQRAQMDAALKRKEAA